MALRAARKWHPWIFCLASFWNSTRWLWLYCPFLSNEMLQWTRAPAANRWGPSKQSTLDNINPKEVSGPKQRLLCESASRPVRFNSSCSWDGTDAQPSERGGRKNLMRIPYLWEACACREECTLQHPLRFMWLNLILFCDQNIFILITLKRIQNWTFMIEV